MANAFIPYLTALILVDPTPDPDATLDVPEAAASSEESDEDSDDDDDIIMPEGPPPGAGDEDSDEDSDGIIMPEGPPPPKPGQAASCKRATCAFPTKKKY